MCAGKTLFLFLWCPPSVLKVWTGVQFVETIPSIIFFFQYFSLSSESLNILSYCASLLC